MLIKLKKAAQFYKKQPPHPLSEWGGQTVKVYYKSAEYSHQQTENCELHRIEIEERELTQLADAVVLCHILENCDNCGVEFLGTADC